MDAQFNEIAALRLEVSQLKKANKQWDEWLSSISDYEGDEAPWDTADGIVAKLRNRVDELEITLSHYRERGGE